VFRAALLQTIKATLRVAFIVVDIAICAARSAAQMAQNGKNCSAIFTILRIRQIDVNGTKKTKEIVCIKRLLCPNIMTHCALVVPWVTNQ